jgi:O-antigen/teichoic acid export membrane protein
LSPADRGGLPAGRDGAAPALPGLRPAGADLTISRLLAGGTWNTLSVVVNRFLPNVFVLFLAFLVPASDLGVYAHILASYTVLSLLADLGIAFSLQKFVQENPEETARIASTALALRFISSLFLASVCVAGDAAWQVLRGSGVLVGVLLIGSAFGTTLYVLNARLKFKRASLLGMGRMILWFILAVGFAFAGEPIAGPVLALAASFVLVGVFSVILEKGLFGGRVWWPMAGRLLKFGVFMTLASAFAVLTSQTGILTLSYMTSETEVGIYRIASTFGLAPMLLSEGLILPLLPLIKENQRRSPHELPDIIRLLMRLIIGLGALFLGCGFVLAGPLTVLLFKGISTELVPTVEILLGASFFGVLLILLLSITYMTDELKIAVRISAFVASLCLLGSLVFIPRAEARGAAWALLASYSAGLVWILSWIRRRYRVRFEWRKYLLYILCGLETALVLTLVIRTVPHPVAGLALAGGFGPVFFVMVLFLQKGLTRAEWAWVRRTLPRRKRAG